MLLHYTGTKYQEDVYHFKLDGGDPRAQWLEKKFTLGLAFPNLPYFIDGIYLLVNLHRNIFYAKSHNLLLKHRQSEAYRVLGHLEVLGPEE
jgi:glutathione S-transferase